LYSGRFVIANTAMLNGTQLTSACFIANTSKDYIQQINSLFTKEFTLEEIVIRKNLING
jgi:hypothetical protein